MAPISQGLIKTKSNEEGGHLSHAEERMLIDCERKISAGWRVFVEVGEALVQIRDGRLYRATHETFEGYCRERWDFRRSRAYQLIDASKIMGIISAGDYSTVPSNEAQVRPLIGLSERQIHEVWSRLLDRAKGMPVTARLVAKTVTEGGVVSGGNKTRTVKGGTQIGRPAVLNDIDQALWELRDCLMKGNGNNDALRIVGRLSEGLQKLMSRYRPK